MSRGLYWSHRISPDPLTSRNAISDLPARSILERRALLRLALASAAGFFLLGILVRIGATEAAEQGWLLAVGTWRNTGLTRTMQAVSWVGSGGFQFPFALLMVALLGWRGERLGVRYFLWALAGWGVYAVLKMVFVRPRPQVLERLSGAGWWSFPSGHAMLGPIIFVLALALLTANPRWNRYRAMTLTVAWLMCGAIATSRVYLGVHYPTDVLAGLLAGGAWTALSLAAMARPGPGWQPAGESRVELSGLATVRVDRRAGVEQEATTAS